MITFSSPESNSPEDSRMVELTKEVMVTRRRVQDLVSIFHQLTSIANTRTYMHYLQVGKFKQAEERVAKGFKVHDGPFVNTLQVALNSFNVQKQAYYSGTFVGNHVHRTLKVRQLPYTYQKSVDSTMDQHTK